MSTKSEVQASAILAETLELGLLFTGGCRRAGLARVGAEVFDLQLFP